MNLNKGKNINKKKEVTVIKSFFFMLSSDCLTPCTVCLVIRTGTMWACLCPSIIILFKSIDCTLFFFHPPVFAAQVSIQLS